MATLVINDLNDDLVNIFRELANKFGAKTQLVTNQPKANPVIDDKLAFNRALQNMPQIDGYDDVDIFARESHTSRDIDWSE